jgi:hypothetical protein
MDRAEAARRGRLGGQATVKKYGIEHMRNLGRAGFAATAARHFGGDRAALCDWLSCAGLAAQDRAANLPPIYDPGPWPGKESE